MSKYHDVCGNGAGLAVAQCAPVGVGAALLWLTKPNSGLVGAVCSVVGVSFRDSGIAGRCIPNFLPSTGSHHAASVRTKNS